MRMKQSNTIFVVYLGEKVRKERDGFLISAIAIDGQNVNDVLVKGQLNSELEALENNCI